MKDCIRRSNFPLQSLTVQRVRSTNENSRTLGKRPADIDFLLSTPKCKFIDFTHVCLRILFLFYEKRIFFVLSLTFFQ